MFVYVFVMVLKKMVLDETKTGAMMFIGIFNFSKLPLGFDHEFFKHG